MVRRRRSTPRGGPGVQLAQIAALVLVLVMILMFRDKIGATAGAFLGAFDSQDVQLPEEQNSTAAQPESAPPAKPDQTD